MTAKIKTKKDRPYYFIVVSYKDDETGKWRERWETTDIPVKGNNKTRAKDRLHEVLNEFKTQQINLSKDVLYVEYLENWLDDMRHSIDPTTYDTYKGNVERRIIPFFKPLKLRVKDVTPAHIQKFVNHSLKTVSSNIVHRYLANVSKCLNMAVKQNLIAYNPVSRIEKPKKVKFTGAKHYNVEQINELLEKSKGDPLEIVILLTVYYGLRRSETLGLKYNAVDFLNNTITIKHTVVPGRKKLHQKDSTKNDSSSSTLPLPEMIKNRLLEWKSQQEANRQLQPNDYIDSDYVCTDAAGNLLKPDFVSSHFKILLKNIGMPHIRFHDLRHPYVKTTLRNNL
jgi:integrase